MPRTPRTAKTPKPGSKTKISPKGQKSITDFTVSKAVEKVQGKFMVFSQTFCLWEIPMQNENKTCFELVESFSMARKNENKTFLI